MQTDVWRQVDKLFQAALDVEPGSRAAYLDKVCGGNALLRSEVESLLTNDSLEWEFIDRPAVESAASLLIDEQSQFEPGQQVAHYEIVSLIGRGGMGEVYLANDGILGRQVALKLLPFEYTQDAARLLRFQREARTVSALNHPNIITIHELGSFHEQKFIATELIEGETLRKRIARGALPILDALDIVIQTAGALAAAHRAGIVHRDIKPENIMVRPDGYVKVLDFGLAKLAEQVDTDGGLRSAEGIDVSSALLLGTPRYMSPEQTSGLPVDPRSDIFSLGVLLYETLTGRLPFDDKNRGELVDSILNRDPTALQIHRDGIPEVLAFAVAKMMSKDRACRYQTAEELILDLRRAKRELGSRDTEIVGHSGTDPLPVVADSISTDPTFGLRNIFRWTARRVGLSVSTVALVILIAFAFAIGYSSYRLLRGAESLVGPSGPSSETGTWAIKAPISEPRLHAEVAVLNDVLYVAGGWKVCSPFSDLEQYDPGTNTWIQRASMLTPRGGHGVGVLNGKIYAVGGTVDCHVHTASVEAYDPVSDSWSEKASLPASRFGHAVAVADGKLYAIGGNSPAGGYLSLNSQYDPHSDTWTERAPLPTPRSAAAVAVVDGIIYVIGGGGYGGTLTTVEAYDPVADAWTSRPSMLMARVSFAAAASEGIIYVFGGRGDRAQVEKYDLAAGTWSTVARMPTQGTHFRAATLRDSIYLVGGSDGVNYSSSVLSFSPESDGSGEVTCPALQMTPRAVVPTERSNMTVGELNGIIYVVGGYEKTSRFLSVNEAYDIAKDTWSAKAPLPLPRETRATNSATVNGKLYMIGGNASGQCSDLNEAYDPQTDRWLRRAPMPTPRCHSAVVALNGLIYALGGTNTSGSVQYNTVEVYDPSLDTWTTAPPMPTARQDLGAVSLNGLLYAVGGGNPALSPGGALNVVEAYDPIRNMWFPKPPMQTARSGLGVGVMNEMVIVIGGVTNEKASGTIEVYDPKSGAWTILNPTAAPKAFLSTVTVNNTIYAFGGVPGSGAEGFVTTTDAITLKPCLNQR